MDNVSEHLEHLVRVIPPSVLEWFQPDAKHVILQAAALGLVIRTLVFGTILTC